MGQIRNEFVFELSGPHEIRQLRKKRKPGWFLRELNAFAMSVSARHSRRTLQDCNEALIVILADTGRRVSELVAPNWEYPDFNAEPAEVALLKSSAAERSDVLNRERESSKEDRLLIATPLA